MKRSIQSLFFGLLTMCLPIFSLPAQTENLSLDKGWRFHQGDIPFPEMVGHQMTYENAKAGQAWGAAAPNYDDSEWRIVNLPHDWAVENPFNPKANISQGYRDRGWGWYRRNFKLSPDDKGKHIELQFDGISTYATIWVNGTILHRNFCGYTSMYIDITPYVYYGDQINHIAVQVDANPMEGWWYEGAGIYRHTHLVKRSPVHIITDGVYAHPVKKTAERWDIPVEVTLYNMAKTAKKATVETDLFDQQGKKLASASTSIETTVLRNAVAELLLTTNNPVLWNLDSPVLYHVVTKVKVDGIQVDEVTTRCGFRTFHFDKDKGFFLNDKPLKIKGVCNHQDHAGVGVALPDALWEFRIRKLKEMGVNAYRVAHNPPSKEFLDLCDEMGMLVMDENRVFNTSPEYARQLEWMVRRDRNHPSVYLWSVFNEEPMQGTENGYEMVRRMSDIVKKLDKNRPVTAAMNGGFFSPVNVMHAVDLVGFNYQQRDYDKFRQLFPDRAYTSSEDGSAFMTRGEYKTDRSKNIMSSYDTDAAPWGATHRNSWKLLADRPHMAGGFYWTGFDYRGEPTPFVWPSAGSFFGIMDLCGFPKAAFYMRQAQWIDNQPVLNLIPHWDWPADTIGKKIQVMAMSNTDSIVLKLNGKVVGGQKADRLMMNSWDVPYHPGKLEAIAYQNGKIVARKVVETTGKPVAVKLTPDRKSLTGNGTDAMPITVELIDAKGRHIATANNQIQFIISGPAAIIGLGNGNPNSHEAEKGNQRKLFNGLAQVIIQSTEQAGEVILTATADGLKSASILIPVLPTALAPFVPVQMPETNIYRWRISPASSEKPDPNQKLADNDMNSWEPVGAGSLHQLGDNKFVVIRSNFRAVKSQRNNGGKITLTQLNGKAEVWLNGELLGKKDSFESGDLTVSFKSALERNEINILLEGNTGSKTGLAGTCKVQ